MRTSTAMTATLLARAAMAMVAIKKPEGEIAAPVCSIALRRALPSMQVNTKPISKQEPKIEISGPCSGAPLFSDIAAVTSMLNVVLDHANAVRSGCSPGSLINGWPKQ